MYNKLVKLRNKKAFTLVEMLAVIAIVAVLVAIVVPIVGKSTTKARAATNAANLRAIEGKLSTARVSDPDLFIDVTNEVGKYVTQLEEFKNAVDTIDFTGGLGWVLGQLGVDAQTKLETYKMCHFTANDNNTITIQVDSRTYTLNDVPRSVAVNAGGTPGMNVPEGTPMTIWISENGFVATYETLEGAYINANFAEVAETGEFNSTPSSKDTAAALECATGHKGPYTNLGESGHRCEHCGATLGHTWGTTGVDGLDTVLQAIAKALNIGSISNGVCSESECKYACTHKNPTTDTVAGIFTLTKCEDCQKWLNGSDEHTCSFDTDSFGWHYCKSNNLDRHNPSWQSNGDGTHSCTEKGCTIKNVTCVDANNKGRCGSCKAHVHSIVTDGGITKCKFCSMTKCEIEGKDHSYSNGVCTNCGSPQNHTHLWDSYTQERTTYHTCKTEGCWLDDHKANWQKDGKANNCCHCANSDCNLKLEHTYTSNGLGLNGAKCDNCGYIKNHAYEKMVTKKSCKHCGLAQNAECHTTS